MKQLMIVGAFFLFFAVQGVSAAQVRVCSIVGAVRCPCAASMIVKCGNDEGFIDDKEPVISATISYVGRDGSRQLLEIESPKSTARDFYVARYCDEVAAALREKGVDVEKADAQTVAITVSESAKLYEDPNMK
jgi:hypothetical protein